ncbi:DinB family protein [Roseobacter ponti]|uniref:Damage-inducible protein DinB n=1 Tax=Roseobacter ponti TaxID=1891787 RepID=A0A858SW36_9RHOB|nr:DinB family protein [Roseobacter ponti]QJF51076.1 damage-inducible protein DinB [Roseobacter ponti]
MIDPGYVRMMARYNSWQNSQLMPLLQDMTLGELAQDRGAFFGGLLSTANHLLWGDTLWMSRFDPSVVPPAAGIPESTTMHPTAGAWAADRFRLDGKIRFWADGVRRVDLKGDMTWYSGAMGREVTCPVAKAIVHFFNHQTHHRGQIHVMITGMGMKAPVSDLFYLPEDD